MPRVFSHPLLVRPPLTSCGDGAQETYWILSVPGCWIAQNGAEQWGAAMEDEVAIRVHGVIPLPMGIANEDR
ncbi:hypothetical protein THAOC_28923, partial [Thalassiosira oceanica]